MIPRRPAVITATMIGTSAAAIAAVAGQVSPVVAAPLAASLALVAATPTAPAARAGVLLAGYAAAVASGIAVSATSLVPAAAVAIAATLGTALMVLLDRLHPPAVAAACVTALQPVGHWQEAVVVLGAAIALAAAVRLQPTTAARGIALIRRKATAPRSGDTRARARACPAPGRAR